MTSTAALQPIHHLGHHTLLIQRTKAPTPPHTTNKLTITSYSYTSPRVLYSHHKLGWNKSLVCSWIESVILWTNCNVDGRIRVLDQVGEPWTGLALHRLSSGANSPMKWLRRALTNPTWTLDYTITGLWLDLTLYWILCLVLAGYFIDLDWAWVWAGFWIGLIW